MGFRFYKRINIGGGLGFNVSKSGISPSVRTPLGSFSSKGFSLRTGIPGLSYRSSGKKGNFLEALVIGVVLAVTLVLFWIAIRIAWRLLLYLLSIVVWVVLILVNFIGSLFGKEKEFPVSTLVHAVELSAQDTELHSAFSNLSTSLMELSDQIAEPAHWEGVEIDTKNYPLDQAIRMGIRVELMYIGGFIVGDGPLRGSGIKDLGFLMLLNKLNALEEKIFFDRNALSKALHEMEQHGAFRTHLAKMLSGAEKADDHGPKLTFLPLLRKVKHQLLDQYITLLNRLAFLLLQEDGTIPSVHRDKFMAIRKGLYGEANSDEKL